MDNCGGVIRSDFVHALARLTAAESPSADVAAVERCGRLLARLGAQITGVSAERIPVDGEAPAALAWRNGDPTASDRVLLLGHMDTVWPIGTTMDRPFTHDGDKITGPGVYDMKSGVLMGLFALRALGPEAPVTLLVTGDEEIGSHASRPLIEAEAKAARAVLVLEGSAPGGALKGARKGWSIYHLKVTGRSAHAGLEPEEGNNALVRLTELVQATTQLADPAHGTTVTPTRALAGETINTVPDQAELTLDIRATTTDEQRRLDREVRRIASTSRAVAVRVEGGINRPPLEESASAPLLGRLRSLESRRGLAYPGAVAVGGVSDANLTAALGVPTLDGLGGVGGGAHAEHEWVELSATLQRIELLTALVTDLIERPEVRSDG